MRTIIIGVLLLVSTPISAQDKEIWACQGTNSSGFTWQNSQWQQSMFAPENYILTIDGESFELKASADWPMSCHVSELDIATCHDLLGQVIVLSKTSGKAVMGSFFGGLIDQTEEAASSIVGVQTMQCTKF